MSEPTDIAAQDAAEQNTAADLSTAEQDTADTDTSPPVSSKRAWLILGVVGLSSFQTALSLSVIFVVYPELTDAFPNASDAELSWVITAFSIVGAAALVLAGAIGDRFGRRRSILWGTAAFSLASAVAALAPNTTVLIIARVAQALASSLTLPAGAATILAAFPKERRGAAIGTWSAVGGVAAAMGPFFGGLLIDAGGWQWAFWINVPMGALAIASGFFVIPEYRTKSKELLPDPFGSAILALGVSALVFAIVQTGEWQWLDYRTISIAIAGLAATTWLVRRSASHPSPILDLRLFSFHSFAFGNISMTLLAFGFFAFQFSSIQFLTEVWDYEVRDAGLLSTPIFACTAVGSWLAGRLTDRFGAAKVVLPGGALWLIGIGWLALRAGETRDLALWLYGVGVGGVGSGLMWGGVFSAVVIDLPERSVALGTAITQTLMRIGSSIGVAVSVSVIGAAVAAGSFRTAFAMSAVSCTIAMMFLWRRERRPEVQPQPGDL